MVQVALYLHIYSTLIYIYEIHKDKIILSLPVVLTI